MSENNIKMPDPLPSPDDIDAVIKPTGLTSRGLAQLLQVNDRTVRHWRSGRLDVPYSNWLAMNYISWLVTGKRP